MADQDTDLLSRNVRLKTALANLIEQIDLTTLVDRQGHDFKDNLRVHEASTVLLEESAISDA